MALKNSQYYAIMREYEKIRQKNHDIQTARYEEVYTKLPEFKSLDESISILSVQYGKKLLNGDKSALSSLKEELEILRSSKKQLLISAGFPEDYLKPIYDCPDCKDTGYIGNQKCHCFKQAIIQLLYDQSNIKEFPTEASFEHFRLDFYPSALYDKTTGRSARAMMEDTLRICHRFIDTFGKEFQNLFFYGSVGVGKTFLSTCIAREIMEKELLLESLLKAKGYEDVVVSVGLSSDNINVIVKADELTRDDTAKIYGTIKSETNASADLVKIMSTK